MGYDTSELVLESDPLNRSSISKDLNAPENDSLTSFSTEAAIRMGLVASPLLLEQLFWAASGEPLHSDGLRLFFSLRAKLVLVRAETGTD